MDFFVSNVRLRKCLWHAPQLDSFAEDLRRMKPTRDEAQENLRGSSNSKLSYITERSYCHPIPKCNLQEISEVTVPLRANVDAIDVHDLMISKVLSASHVSKCRRMLCLRPWLGIVPSDRHSADGFNG